MKRSATPWRLLVALLLALVPAAAHAQQSLILDMRGFDYQDPDPSPGSFGVLGSGYVGVGDLTGLYAPLVFDATNNYYTYIVHGMSVTSVVPFGQHVAINYTGGTLEIYEDSKSGGTDGVWAPDPPNAQSPGTFTDGSLYLHATLTNFQFVIDTNTLSGSYEGDITFDGGAHLGDLPANDRSGWTFAGVTSRAANIPHNWYHQVAAESFVQSITVTRRSSWGGIKNLYR